MANVTIQMAIVDMLKSLHIKPAGVFGDSFGEIACAYFEGILTAEEAALLAYHLADFMKDFNEPSYPYIIECNGNTVSW